MHYINSIRFGENSQINKKLAKLLYVLYSLKYYFNCLKALLELLQFNLKMSWNINVYEFGSKLPF